MRIINDGAEFGDNVFWDMAGVDVTSLARTGNYSYRVSSTSVQPNKTLENTISEFYFRYGSYIDSVSYIAGDLFLWRYGSTKIGSVYIDLDNYVCAKVGDTVAKTSETLFPRQSWVLLEGHVLLATSGRIDIKLDGKLILEWTGNTTYGGYSQISNVRFSNIATLGNYPYQYIDDFGMNDTFGTSDNSWLGDGHYTVIFPNENGDVNQWVPSSGTGTNYLMVDEFPPDGDTTYVGAVSGYIQDMYHLTSIDGTSKTITRIYPEVRARDFSGTSQTMRVGYKFGNVVYLTSGEILGYNYSRLVGNDALLNPSGLNWVDTELNSMQLVLESGVTLVA